MMKRFNVLLILKHVQSKVNYPLNCDARSLLNMKKPHANNFPDFESTQEHYFKHFYAWKIKKIVSI